MLFTAPASPTEPDDAGANLGSPAMPNLFDPIQTPASVPQLSKSTAAVSIPSASMAAAAADAIRAAGGRNLMSYEAGPKYPFLESPSKPSGSRGALSNLIGPGTLVSNSFSTGSQSMSFEPLVCPSSGCDATLDTREMAEQHCKLHMASEPVRQPLADVSNSPQKTQPKSGVGPDLSALPDTKAINLLPTSQSPGQPLWAQAQAAQIAQQFAQVHAHAQAQAQAQAQVQAQAQTQAQAQAQVHAQAQTVNQTSPPTRSVGGMYGAPKWPTPASPFDYEAQAKAYLSAVGLMCGNQAGSPDSAMMSTAPSSIGSPAGPVAGPSNSGLSKSTGKRRSRRTRSSTANTSSLPVPRTRIKGTFPCQFCHITVSRMDSLTRHMKRKHPIEVQAAGGNIGSGPLGISALHSRASPAASTSTSSATSVTNPSTMATTPTTVRSSLSSPPADLSLSGSSEKKQYACTHCGLTLSRLDSLVRHLKKQHNQVHSL